MAGKAREAFRTISEVADWLDVPAHVLRFWESKFSQIKPVKRAGGRRYYRPEDMELIGGIKKLLHDDGMTIRGVQKLLKEDGVKSVAALSPSLDGVEDAASPRTQRRKAETPDIEDAIVEEDAAPADDAASDDRETIAEWDADAREETSQSSEPERPPLVIEATTAEDEVAEPVEKPAEEEPVVDAADEAAEAPFVEVPEDTTRGGDNVVELAARSEPEEPEQETEPEASAETEEPAPSEPAPAEPAAQLEESREKTLPPPAAPPAAEPATESDSAEGFRLTDAQTTAIALRRKLRGANAKRLEVAAAAQVARLQALRDRLAEDLTGR